MRYINQHIILRDSKNSLCMKKHQVINRKCPVAEMIGCGKVYLQKSSVAEMDLRKRPGAEMGLRKSPVADTDLRK